MTAEEKAFNDALDAHPDDHTVRLVYADWLDEHHDPRGPGYRALGVNERNPVVSGGCPFWFESNMGYSDYALPADWYGFLDVAGKHWKNAPAWHLRHNATRREVEDAAALAFSRLPPERQAELLTPACPAASG